MTGSVDVLALAPQGSSANHGRGKQWLHLDYSPPQGMICQATIQLLPDTEATGKNWERIALMVCKAPVSWMSPRAEHALLACCVSGAASRATAAVTLGKLHAECQEPSKVGCRRILPAIQGASLNAISSSPAASSVGCSSEKANFLIRLRCLTPDQLMKRFAVEDLRLLVPVAVLRYISPSAVELSDKLAPLSERAQLLLNRLLERERLSAVPSNEPSTKAKCSLVDSPGSGIWPSSLQPQQLQIASDVAATLSSKRVVARDTGQGQGMVRTRGAAAKRWAPGEGVLAKLTDASIDSGPCKRQRLGGSGLEAMPPLTSAAVQAAARLTAMQTAKRMDQTVLPQRLDSCLTPISLDCPLLQGQRCAESVGSASTPVQMPSLELQRPQDALYALALFGP